LGLRIVYSQHRGQIIRLEYADSRDAVYEKNGIRSKMHHLRPTKSNVPAGRKYGGDV
jgi:hypothetical protein